MNLFCSTSLTVLDGFDQHFQATVNFPLSSAINKLLQDEQFFPSKKLRNAGNQNTGQLGPEASKLTIVLCCPPLLSGIKQAL